MYPIEWLPIVCIYILLDHYQSESINTCQLFALYLIIQLSIRVKKNYLSTLRYQLLISSTNLYRIYHLTCFMWATAYYLFLSRKRTVLALIPRMIELVRGVFCLTYMLHEYLIYSLDCFQIRIRSTRFIRFE